MNLLVEAQMDEQRNLAARKISRETRLQPKLYVEGLSDARLLKYYWQYHSVIDFRIDVLRVGKTNFSNLGGKEVVIKKVEQVGGDITFGLVDMDHDFNGSEISGSQVLDTNPKVTLNSFCVFGNNFHNIVESICSEFKVSISSEDRERVRSVSKAYTCIKLFKGQNDISDETKGGYSWSDIDFSSPNLTEYIGDLHFLDLEINNKFKIFQIKNAKHLKVCGLNDHMLCQAIQLYLNSMKTDWKDLHGIQRTLNIEGKLNQQRFRGDEWKVNGHPLAKFAEQLRNNIRKRYKS